MELTDHKERPSKKRRPSSAGSCLPGKSRRPRSKTSQCHPPSPSNGDTDTMNNPIPTLEVLSSTPMCIGKVGGVAVLEKRAREL
ncbi:hypothetical protein SCHPADRAFT_909379 [Schizopora paradoxa]|uniref:Uncharacterized protein n=1 Tax=Schizopora paradoxa TaxID=27342 RepID=A0A0H2R6S5_9AGAM|nr:hypothetical protein SCHPADRAFT_909379 [Schizopora paradoxa]